MEKTWRATLWIGIVLLLLGIAACNLPFFSPSEDEVATAAPPSNADAPSNTDGAETILIPWGTFTMGSESTDTRADEDEMPSHEVTLDGFYLYTHEVTNSMYAECVTAGACLPVTELEAGPTSHYADPVYAEHPVVGVDWNMAEDYCAWAGGRLPTEAEWERAARGSESLVYPWGDSDPTCDQVNMLGCTVPPGTVEVGSFLFGNSPEGVWDLAGNVWEWVHDWYDEDTYSLSPTLRPLGPYAPEDHENPLKVVRGGGLYSESIQLRGAARTGINPYRVYDDVGFRCVAVEGPGVPEDYVPTDDRHERVPPGDPDEGGETVDEPERMEFLAYGFALASCPFDGSMMHVVIEAMSSIPGLTYEVTVEGNLFTCTYDEVLHLLACTGPVPENDDELSEYHYEVHPSVVGAVFHGIMPKPVDCDAPPPDRFSIDLDCPEDGLFIISFFYDPPITWDIVRIGDMDIPCVAVSAEEIQCRAPDLPVGDHYEFYLHGTGEGGGEYEWTPWVPVRDDCPVHFLDADLSTGCFEGHETVEVLYLPEIMSIGSVVADGVPLGCFGMAPNVMICTGYTGEAGDPLEVTVCTDIGTCFTETLTISGCPGEATFPGYLIEPYCYPPEAPAPAASIHYWPFAEHLVSATVGATDLSCSDWGGGWYICPGLPGSPGELLSVNFCLEDGRCENSSITVPDCGAPPPGESDWRMSSIGCHDATRIYFQIDTGLEWLIPGADFTYSATDGETTYACTINPAVVGRIYCAGTRPLVPGPLEFCLQRAGDPAMTCQTYPNFNTWVGGIESCAPPEEEPHIPSCADYTDYITCGSDHKGECIWIYDEPAHCEELEP